MNRVRGLLSSPCLQRRTPMPACVRPRLVGIDSLNIDDINDLARPVHTRLLGAGIPIVEHLCCLSELPKAGFRFSAVPVKVRGMGTFPVRAFASLESRDK